jgi:hypothetical protein
LGLLPVSRGAVHPKEKPSENDGPWPKWFWKQWLRSQLERRLTNPKLRKNCLQLLLLTVKWMENKSIKIIMPFHFPSLPCIQKSIPMLLENLPSNYSQNHDGWRIFDLEQQEIDSLSDNRTLEL